MIGSISQFYFYYVQTIGRALIFIMLLVFVYTTVYISYIEQTSHGMRIYHGYPYLDLFRLKNELNITNVTSFSPPDVGNLTTYFNSSSSGNITNDTTVLTQLPGPFISDRYGWNWWFLMMSHCRLMIPFFFIFAYGNLVNLDYKRWFGRLVVLYVVFDVLLLIYFLIVYMWFCNSTLSNGSPCNDVLIKWCANYGMDHPDKCPYWTYTFLGPYHLNPNPDFILWCYYTIAFLFLDIVCYIVNSDSRKTIKMFIQTII